jgi:hypothetical protein
MTRTYRFLSFILLCGCFCLACTSVQLVSPYDEQIDTSLTELNTDLTAFILKMNSVAGTPQGMYEANRQFYFDEQAKVQTIILRVEAHKVLGSCPSTDIIKYALAHSQIGGDAAQYQAQIPQDDCEVVLISLIQKNLALMEKFHHDQGPKGIPTAAEGPILVGGLGALIESAIIVELAKKGKTPTG